MKTEDEQSSSKNETPRINIAAGSNFFQSEDSLVQFQSSFTREGIFEFVFGAQRRLTYDEVLRVSNELAGILDKMEDSE